MDNAKKDAGRKNRGVTLVELLVSITIFSLAMIIIVETFISSVRIGRAFLSKVQAMDEVSYLMEHMSREIRMAQKDETNACGNGAGVSYALLGGGSGIGFKNFTGKCVKIYKNGETLYEDVNGVVNPLTSPPMKVANFNAGGGGWDSSDEIQPRVALYLKMRYGRFGTAFDIQTSVSQRNPDIH